MARRREIAGSPVRSAAEAWDAISELITVTLGRSPNIADSAVRSDLATARAAGHALLAAGHLDRMPLTVVAEPLYLTITTVSGQRSFAVLEDENPNPVPGAATATTWMVYLPRPDGISALLDEVVIDIEHVTTDAPPEESTGTDASTRAASIDLRRLDPAVRSRS